MNIELKIAILVDPMGGGGKTAEEEVEAHKITFTALLDPAEIRFEHVWNPGAISPGTDIVVYDFGGMMPGTDLMESNARAITQWAIDNPSSLVVVASGFTYKNYVEYELEQLGFDELFNMVNDDGHNEDPIPQWFRDAFELPKCDAEKVYEAQYPDPIVIDLVKEDIVHHEDEPKELPLPEEPDTTDWSKEAPKEPIGFITVPVYCDWHPGVHRGSARFKIADCMVDVTDDDDKPLGHMGGAFYGFYECSFPDNHGSLWSYFIKPKDFWSQFEKLHTDVKDNLQEMP
jgi:hypothetical protein